jgi:hypothetical protein
MRVTVPFNIGMTFALIGYMTLLFPMMPAEDAPMLAESMFPDSEPMQILAMLISVVLAAVAGTFIFRALWNRLFPHLCGWKPVNLAESYAFALVAGVLMYGAN